MIYAQMFLLLTLMNGSLRYWLLFHANECIFSRNEQQKV